MRKVTREAVNAFYAGRNYRNKNTVVKDRTLYLHGNPIAWFSETPGGNTLLVMTLAGWPTVTTRERLNGLGRGAFYQRDHGQYFSGMCYAGVDEYNVHETLEIEPHDYIEVII